MSTDGATPIGPAAPAARDAVPAGIAAPAPLPADLPTLPPALLHARHITDAHEVLVLSYTSDLHFFESTCLGDALASTGRVTVVRDADKGVPAAETRLAGVRYLDVPVRCRSGGAFHPKLVVIAGQDRAVAAIGSGNVTASGWHYNAELWTAIVGEGPTWPSAFAELAAWLHKLPGFLHIDDFGARRIRDVAELLDGRQYSGGAVLAHNLDRPIIEQLPIGPVPYLNVASPFLDPKAAALRALRSRLHPRELHVALTRGASFGADALADALEASDPDCADPSGNTVATASVIDSQKYHHGKLVQWDHEDGSRGALVGSANCTAAALLATASDTHGNCELGLIVHGLAGRDLMPGTGDPLDRAGLVEHALAGPPLPSDRAAATPFLARALRVAAGLEMTVLGTAASSLAGAELVWNGEAVSVTGVQDDGRCFAFAAAAAGALVWIRFADGHETAPVPVTDPTRVMVRLEKPSPLEQHSLAAVLADPSLTQELLDALEQLATVRPRTPHGAAKSDRSAAEWLEQWEMAASAALGPSLVALALGLDGADPATGHASPHDGAALRAEPLDGELGDVDVDDEADLEDLLDAELAAAEQQQTPQDRRRAERHRLRVVRLLAARAQTAATWSLPAQMSLLRVLMIAVASGLFHDHAWSPAVASLARAVVQRTKNAAGGQTQPGGPAAAEAPGDAAETDGSAAAALAPRGVAVATVCLALIARDIASWAGTSPDLDDFRKVRDVLPDDSDGVDVKLVCAYAAGLERLLGVTMSADAIVDALDHLLGSPLQQLADSLSTDRIAVEAVGPRLLLAQAQGQARRVAYSVLQKAQSHGPLIVIARTPAETVALAWATPELAEVTSSSAGGHGRRFRAAVGPGAAASGDAKPVDTWRGPLPAAVEAFITNAGLPVDQFQ